MGRRTLLNTSKKELNKKTSVKIIKNMMCLPCTHFVCSLTSAFLSSVDEFYYTTHFSSLLFISRGRRASRHWRLADFNCTPQSLSSFFLSSYNEAKLVVLTDKGGENVKRIKWKRAELAMRRWRASNYLTVPFHSFTLKLKSHPVSGIERAIEIIKPIPLSDAFQFVTMFSSGSHSREMLKNFRTLEDSEEKSPRLTNITVIQFEAMEQVPVTLRNLFASDTRNKLA